MKSLAFTVWLFINLLCFGMCGYLYLIWSKYWFQMESEKYISPKTPRREYPKSPEIIYYGLNMTTLKLKNKNNQYAINDISKESIKMKPNVINKNEFNNIKTDDLLDESDNIKANFQRDTEEKYVFPKIKQSPIKSIVTRESGDVKTQFIENKNSAQPRFNLETPFIEFDSSKYKCLDKNYNSESCKSKIDKYKVLLFREFDRRLRNDEKQAKTNNRYNVTYDFKPVPKNEGFGKYNSKNRDELLCDLKKVNIKTIKPKDEPFASYGFENKLPKLPLLKYKHFNSCAIVTSAGALFDSNLGSFIDSHDLVMRFNHAPTLGHEKDVGKKTTIRIVNSKVMTGKEFHFQTADIFRNVSILAWDPSDYSGNLHSWYKKPDFDLFSQYKRFMRRNPFADFHLLNPKTLWDLWDYLQDNTPFRISRNPPSSGFLGFAVLLQYCSTIDIVEYLPSVRVSKRCHYYGPEVDTACTFGAWHPLAAEKLTTWKISESKDYDTFYRGIMSVRSETVCSVVREL